MKNLTFIALLAIFCSSCTQENKIYEWRGPDRSGIYQETGLMKEWPEDGPEEIWIIKDIGNGYGSPLFVEDKFYITGALDSMALLFCFDLDGKELWRTDFGLEWIVNYPGSRSAPTVVGDLLYVSSGMGNLYCFDATNGEKVWSKDFEDDFQGIFPLFGHSEAVLTDGDKLFWTPGGKEHNAVALDRYTGELLWSNPGFGERSAYNPPKLIELPARKILVTFSAYHLMGFDTETGELLWSHEQDNWPLPQRKPGYGDTHSNTVIYDDGAIYYAAGDGNGGVKLNLSEDGSELSDGWRNKGFDSYMGGIVKIDNYLYGSGTMKKELRAINAETGVLTDSLNIGSGALIAADNMLYYYTQRGTLNLVSYDAGDMELISSFRVKKGTKEHFAHPVIYRGILHQRHGKVLMAYDIREK